MRRSLPAFMLLVVMAGFVNTSFAGQPAGDATVSRKFLGNRTVMLPSFSISRAGEYTFEVNVAGEPTFPHWLRIKSPSSNNEPDHSAEAAKIRVDVLSPSGRVIHSKMVKLNSGREAGTDILQYQIWDRRARSQFTLDRYFVRVAVLSPSPNRRDTAFIVGGSAQ